MSDKPKAAPDAAPVVDTRTLDLLAPTVYGAIDWDAPMPSAPISRAPLPESWTAQDDAVTDAEIIETVSAHYGWNWIDTVERVRKIDFDKARAEA